MSENIVKRSEFVYTREQRYTKVIYYYYFHGCAAETCTSLHRLFLFLFFVWYCSTFMVVVVVVVVVYMCAGEGRKVEVQNVFYHCAFVTHA